MDFPPRPMNSSKVFGIVLLLHVVAIGFLIVQPGCQTTPPPPPPEPTSPVPSPTADPTPPGPPPSPFNAGLQPQATGASARTSGREAPTRPSGGTTVDHGSPLLAPVGSGPAPAVTAPTVATSTRYVVVRGDTMSAIARQHGVGLDELLEANGMTRQSVIRIGQEITIPGREKPTLPAATPPAPTVTPPALAPGLNYTVVAGDSLSRIARQHGVTVNALREANALRSDQIQIGQVLVIPGATAPAAGAPAAPTPPPPSAPAASTYRVQGGDTLGAIAARFGVSVADLQQANGISDPRRLRVGQDLVIPGTAASPPPSVSAQSGPVPRPAAGTTPGAVVPVPAPPPARPVTTLEDLDRLITDGEGDVPLVPIDEGN